MKSIFTYCFILLMGISGTAQINEEVAQLTPESSAVAVRSWVPHNLDAVINLEGEVYLRWECSAHDSILGYKVFFSDLEVGTYKPFVNGIIDQVEATKFVEQDNDKKDLFFKVLAVDSSLVQSDYSNVATVKTFDVVPPQKPELKSLDVLKDGLFLTWLESEDKDIKSWVFERVSNLDKEPVLITIDKTAQNSYIDETAERGRWYTYKMYAIDHDDNKSAGSNELEAFAEDMSPKDGAQNLQIEALEGEDVKLKVSWEIKNKTVFKYEIYRAVNGKGYEIYSKILAGKNEFIDSKVKRKKIYSYQIRAIYSDGTLSPLSDEIIIEL